MKHLRFPLLALAIFAAAPAPGARPASNAELARAESAIRAAENAGATEHARDLLDRARGDLAAAQHDWQDRRWESARHRIAEAEAAASAAESKAKALAMIRQADDLKREGDDFERRAREVSPQAPH